jgi:hypothetical protein
VRDVNAAILLLIAVSQEPRLKSFQNLDYLKHLKLQMTGKVLEADARPTSGGCAIPLLNALRDDKSGDSKMPILKPQGEFKMPIITPVPVCENFGK